MRSWKLLLYTGAKNKQSGRPVRNILFDKVAMSSLNTMIQYSMLPRYDCSMALAMKEYLIKSDQKILYSKGWARKFSDRFNRFVQDKKDGADDDYEDDVNNDLDGHVENDDRNCIDGHDENDFDKREVNEYFSHSLPDNYLN